jgi:hypothetical protein
VGAVVGGAGNHLLGRRVLTTSRRAFGAAPNVLPVDLEPAPGSEKLEARMLRGARFIGSKLRRGPREIESLAETSIPDSSFADSSTPDSSSTDRE